MELDNKYNRYLEEKKPNKSDIIQVNPKKENLNEICSKEVNIEIKLEEIKKKDLENMNLNSKQKGKNKIICEKESYSKTSFQLFIQKEKQINLIEGQNNFQILKEEENFGENEMNYLLKIKPKGLMNLGGCCYMNSTLQCFFHIKEFTHYFLCNKKFIRKKDGPITTGLLDLIEGLSKESFYSYYIPLKFKSNLIKEYSSFEGTEGKDSSDLVSIILSSCHDELAKESNLADITLDQRQQSLLFLDLFYKNSQAPSIINELFIFYVRIESICFECGTKYYDISTDDKILFNLKQVFRLNSEDFAIEEDNRIVTLENCLSCFSFGCSFDKKKYICQYCKKNACIFSVQSFATLPKYLIMIMKRGKNEIFECQVSFEENINLEDSYYNVPGMPREKYTKYSLLGGTILYGSKGHGHTVAFCKHFDGNYYIFNDSSFELTNFDKIKKQKIYLLFYKKDEPI